MKVNSTNINKAVLDSQETLLQLEKEKSLALAQAKAATQVMLSIQEQYDIINALSNDYLNIYAVYPEKDCADVIKLDGYVTEGVSFNAKAVPYTKTITIYCNTRVFPDDRQEFLQTISLDNIIKQLKTLDKIDLTYRTLIQGQIHYYSLRYTKVSKAGETLRLVAGFRCVDSIIEEEQRHKTTSEEAKALSLIHESLGSGNWSMKFDKDSKMIQCTWSDKFRFMLGYKNKVDFPDTLESWSDLLHIEDKDWVLKEYWDTVNDYTGAKTYNVEYRLLTKNFGYKWFHAAGRLSRRDDGSPDTFYGVFMNIDAQKHHHAIAEEAKALSLIHESLGSGNWSMEFNQKGMLTKVIWSKHFRTMLGYHNKNDFPDVLESWTDLIHPDYKKKVLKLFWGAIEDKTGKTIYDTKYPCLTRKRGYRWMHDACRLSRRPDGSPEMLYGVFIDIDDTIKKDAKLKNALTLAQKANKAKTIFLNNMSHDIRTPMNAIIGFTSLAKTHSTNPSLVLDYLSKIQTSSRHLLSLINDVLDMSRIESGKVQIQMSPASILDILSDLKTITQDDVIAKKLDFSVEAKETKDIYVICDKLRLSQALLNLVSNATKFTPEGGKIKVSVEESPCCKTGFATYKFKVKDWGLGIDKTFLPHIFEPFEREKNSTVSGIPGTGLGLSITKNIVELMGGNIKVKSKTGVGSSFSVFLDLQLCKKEDVKTTKQKDSPCDSLCAKEKRQKFLGKRVLLAEDNLLNQEIAQEILKQSGFIVETADNGKIAVDMVQKAPTGYYTLVLMDIQMPVMSGYEATTLIRALDDKQKACIPILAMTANAFEEDKKQAIKTGMNGYIAKPIDIKQMTDLLLEFC